MLARNLCMLRDRWAMLTCVAPAPAPAPWLLLVSGAEKARLDQVLRVRVEARIVVGIQARSGLVTHRTK